MKEIRSTADRWREAAFYLICGFILVYLISPVAAVVPISFTSGNFIVYPLESFSLRWYETFFATPQWRNSLTNSIMIGITSTLIATGLGTIAAVGLDGLGKGWRSAGNAVVMLPVVTPAVVTGNSLFSVLGHFNLTSTFSGVVLAHCVVSVPFVVITVGASLRGFDHGLMRAAVSLGASPIVAFRRVMLPLILPSVIAGAVFAFATSFDEVVMTLLIAGSAQQTLPLEMLKGLREQLRPTIAAAATILVFISVMLLACVEFLRRN